MVISWYLLIFFVGAAIGSFLNVLISRSVQGEDWVKGRSRCDHCKKTLAWYDMFPVISYLVYRGRSRCCHKPLSLQHIVVESLIGFLFVWWLLVGRWFFHLVNDPFATIQPAFWLIIGILLMGIFVTDLFYGLIPSLFVGGGTALVLFYRLVLAMGGEYQWRDLGLSVLTATAAWLFFWFLRYITKGRGMGDGDLVLAFLLGLLLGWPKTLVWVWMSFVLGAFVSIILLAFKVKRIKSTVPFGPFMIAAAWVTLVWGDRLLTWLY